MKRIWDKIHALESILEYFLEERNSKPEVVKSKHAWDMILLHICRELSDCKAMIVTRMEEDNQ